MGEQWKEIAQQVSRIRSFTDRQCDAMALRGERVTVSLPDRNLTAAYYKADRAHAPVLFMFHGGGFCFGHCCQEDLMYDQMRRQMDVNVVSVGYRKMEPFPHALTDCWESISYFLQSLEYDFDRDRIMLGGSSAGANLAIGVGTLAKRRGGFRVWKELLNYPFLDLTVPQAKKSAGTAEDSTMYDYFYHVYAPEEQRADPLVSPRFLTAEDVDPGVNTMIILADCDPLHREGAQFAETLRSFGSACTVLTAAGMSHGYFEYGYKQEIGWCPPEMKRQLEDGSLKRACDWAMDQLTAFVRTE